VQERALEEALSDYNDSVNYVHLMYANSTQQVFSDWTVLKMPTLVLVGRDGVVRYRSDGQYVPSDAVRQMLESIK